ncbi:MAG TPA: CDP-alcohol phosphatidyltransferase family protein [Acidimicrobiia bacterium]
MTATSQPANPAGASTGAGAASVATAATAAAIRKRFGQSAIATPANAVTITRIAIALPTLALIYRNGSNWLNLALWFAVTSSDSLDGWLARRDGATRSGAFLDPLADKTIVLGGLGVLAARGDIFWWPVLLIAAREIGFSIYRSIAGKRGIVLPAQQLGKYKAFTQYGAVGLVVLPLTSSWLGVQQLWLAVAVVLTVASGLQILQHGYVDWQRDR